jgi:hypothetical protein
MVRAFMCKNDELLCQNDIEDNVESSPLVAPIMASGFARWIFSRMANPEAFVPDGEPIEVIRAELSRTSLPPDVSLDSLVAKAIAWSSAEYERFGKQGVPTEASDRQLMIRKAVLWWAPIGLASGAWLQWLSSPKTADQPLFLKILNLYASDIGAGFPGASRGNAYLGLLRQIRTSERAIPLARLASDVRIDDRAFDISAMLLLMSRRPEDFCEELIGADLCLRSIGMPPPLALARQDLQLDWTLIDYSSSRGSISPVDECYSIAESLVLVGTESAKRVYTGFAWTLSTLIEQVEALHEQLNSSLDPWFDMAELMKLRAREGSVYHAKVKLEKRSLQEWLKECRINPGPFLEVLARSKLIKPGRSDISPLVSGLVNEQGPMFRIFSPDDLVVISRWINALPENPEPSDFGNISSINQYSSKSFLTELPSMIESGSASNGNPKNLREAYHCLMTRPGSPEMRNWCLKYIDRWLDRARYRMGSHSMQLPVEWRPEVLRLWLQDQHDRHAAEFSEETERPMPSREAVIDDAVQTSLLTLIDGSWLQGFTDYELASSDIGHSLFSTYWDELGNGEPDLNHPLIYRDTLKGMSVDLPPTGSLEFVNWSGFRDASFELPVYWLCIGRFPRTYLPETLGLNLAMELSGVGGTYRRAKKELAEYGFSTRFVDVHNTIDNVATGHSAWAADAIDTFMTNLPDSSGPGGRREVWDCIRAGYRSLNPPRGFMARNAGLLKGIGRRR